MNQETILKQGWHDNLSVYSTQTKYCNFCGGFKSEAYAGNPAFCRCNNNEKLERELAKKTNEVARLRELLERAIEAIEEEGCPKTANDIREELAPLAPSPEETETSAHIDKCIGNVTEPANPTCANTTHKFSHCDCEEPVPEWRELGPDEIPQTGDQWYDGKLFGWVRIEYSTKEPASRFTFPIRTRRPDYK